MIFRNHRHFRGILFKSKAKKNQIPALGRDLARGLRPYGLAACAADGASRSSGPAATTADAGLRRGAAQPARPQQLPRMGPTWRHTDQQ
jgi:hypothetical protein